jgi:RHS repeat-associated protein
LHRLKIATHKDYILSQDGSFSLFFDRFNEFVDEYDPIGNIKKLRRNGYNQGTFQFGEVDRLTYNYSGSRLSGILEESNTSVGFRNSSTYSHDNNGNLSGDSGKGFGTINSNFLNLPSIISGTSGTIQYAYDASGKKLQKNGADDFGNPLLKQYAGIVEYANGGIEAIYHTDGRIVSAQPEPGWRIEYMIKDHLGSTRVLFSDLNNDNAASLDEVLTTTDYYPFGMTIERGLSDPEVPKNDYLFNGKGLDSDLRLNWYHYGARFYDPAIGRWNGVDPLAANYLSWSTYNYVMGNPISFIDPDGRGVESTHTDANGNVLAVYDDGDLSIYRHNSIASPDLWHGNLLNVNMDQKDVTKMGETLVWDSFYNGAPYGNIDFNSFDASEELVTFRDKIAAYHTKHDEIQTIIHYMKNAGTSTLTNVEIYDYKTRGGEHLTDDVDLMNYRYRGSQISKGIFVSARDVGNIEAGYVAGVFGIGLIESLKMTGMFNANENVINLGLLRQLGSNWSPPYGETMNSHNMQKLGYSLGVSNRAEFFRKAKGY